ncbi:MAG: arsenite methyltransferase [Mycobacterium sp.]|jgi:arsenite methyltransferase|nr:arsenite methyltransferase [Mycobacterium sp.]
MSNDKSDERHIICEVRSKSFDRAKVKADYGYDGDYSAVSAPTVATIAGATSAALLASAARSLARGKPVAAAITGGTGVSPITSSAMFIRSTRIGKFEVWSVL